VTDERELIEKLLRIEALFARAGTPGEKQAAASAAERIRSKIKEWAVEDPAIEHRLSVTDGWSRRLLLALLRRYGIEPYRYRSQRRTTVMARVPRRFVEETLWPEFREFDQTLQAYLAEVTERVILEAMGDDGRDEEVRPDAVQGRQLPGSSGR